MHAYEYVIVWNKDGTSFVSDDQWWLMGHDCLICNLSICADHGLSIVSQNIQNT